MPRLIFVNKMDRAGADAWECITGARERLGLSCAAMQVNIGVENGLQGLVDLVSWEACFFDGDSGETVRREPIPADMLDFCIEKKLELIGTLADYDEVMEEHYLEENYEIDPVLLQECIRKHTINLNFCPVFMGSAFKNKGVQLLLDGVISYLPNPTEVTNIALDTKRDEEKVELAIDNKKPFVGLAFKLEETQYG